MSHNTSRTNAEHGNVINYTVGFVLSLILTYVAYHIVVNQTLSSNLLLVSILGLAFAQLLVQIFYFLHLGRGPKPKWNLYFFVATAGMIVMVVGGSILIINNLHYNMSPVEQAKKLVDKEGIYQISGEETGACKGQHPNHQITIKDDRVDPTYVFAEKCDTLTFINKDDAREITFGTHPKHGAYAGETDLFIKKGKNKTITLSETGTFQYHDHFEPEVTGFFTVAE